MPRKIQKFDAAAAARGRAFEMSGIVAAQGERLSPTVDDTLKTRRQSLGLRTESVSAALAIAHSSLRNYESGRSLLRLPPHQLQDLMQILQVSFDELLLLCANTAATASPEQLRGIGWESRYPKDA